ncbi:MAG: dTDP-4-dehydrorhamnose 3,5-epimerase [Fuerstiella sp.]
MNIIETKLKGVVMIETRRFGDARGYFTETFHSDRYLEAGIERPFVQDNFSHSVKGVLRGLHYQIRNPQGKLVTVLAGEVFDVAIDLQIDSTTFGEWVGVNLSSENGRQLYVPPGFGHGFCVLSDTADFLYKCTDFYSPEYERAVRWDDPDLGIDWPVSSPVISDKDAAAPRLKNAELFGLHRFAASECTADQPVKTPN